MAKTTTNTVFRINGENIEVEGAGQQTVSAVIKGHPKNTVIILQGWTIDGQYMPLFENRN